MLNNIGSNRSSCLTYCEIRHIKCIGGVWDPIADNNAHKISDHSFSALITINRKHMESSTSETDESKRRNLLNMLLKVVWR